MKYNLDTKAKTRIKDIHVYICMSMTQWKRTYGEKDKKFHKSITNEKTLESYLCLPLFSIRFRFTKQATKAIRKVSW